MCTGYLNELCTAQPPVMQLLFLCDSRIHSVDVWWSRVNDILPVLR